MMKMSYHQKLCSVTKGLLLLQIALSLSAQTREDAERERESERERVSERERQKESLFSSQRKNNFFHSNNNKSSPKKVKLVPGNEIKAVSNRWIQPFQKSVGEKSEIEKKK